MRRSYQETADSEKLKLVRLLAKVHVEGERKSTQSEDNIFGMLGMANDSIGLGVFPQYGKSISLQTIYTDTARAIVTSGEVGVLSFYQYPDVDNRNGFPSWVPDWRGKLSAPAGQLP
jgi:hypothetical protein